MPMTSFSSLAPNVGVEMRTTCYGAREFAIEDIHGNFLVCAEDKE
jgi:hypothetical protein